MTFLDFDLNNYLFDVLVFIIAFTDDSIFLRLLKVEHLFDKDKKYFDDNYPAFSYKQKIFLKWNNLFFLISDKTRNEVLRLPISPVLTEEEVSFIVEILNRY
ncbi:hypothetical protein [Flavobacterium chilense]|uniref:Uncharacterized protein n=1 Tax=Flavobacterium chilense TaxID=946677 RepID=A0A1M6XYX8_9FLAO|nr:hypothetical protein [Flavobacterium chilense]SHL11043.1 hypothetical protein SAMN05444484_101339 [Flavobacterium chilense]